VFEVKEEVRMNAKSVRILALVLLGCSVSALADTASPAKVTWIQVNANGAIRFSIASGTMCATGAGGGPNTDGDIQVNHLGVTLEAQRAMLSILVSAKLSGNTVKIFATNGVAGTWGCAVSAVQIN
jgi:hypothetical protein